MSGHAESLHAAPEDFLTLYCDPGEDFGWCVGKDMSLLAAGTEKMWRFADHIWQKIGDPTGAEQQLDPMFPELNPLSADSHVRSGVDPELMKLPIGRVVCEDFRIYPWEMENMAFDKVRTARVIGAITFMCRLHQIPLRFQGANIKAAAVAAGAEELYYKPLTENRHQNDAIQHYVFFTNPELLGLPLPIPESVHEEDHS